MCIGKKSKIPDEDGTVEIRFSLRKACSIPDKELLYDENDPKNFKLIIGPILRPFKIEEEDLVPQ